MRDHEHDIPPAVDAAFWRGSRYGLLISLAIWTGLISVFIWSC